MLDFVPQFLVDGFLLGGLYTLAAVGLALSFGVIRFINFAHGESFMLGAYGAFWAAQLLNADPLLSLLPLTIAGGLVGYLLFRTLFRTLVDAPHINQILVTFGLAIILYNVALILWTSDQRATHPAYSLASFELFDGLVFVPMGRLIACVVALALAGLLFWWLRFTELGRASRALSENREAAALMGIPVQRMYAIAFGISTALGAATGVLLSFVFAVTPFMGFDMLVKGFAIILLGGMGTVIGAVVGAFVLAYGETFCAYFIPDGTGWAEGIAYALLLGILLLRPRGILGRVVEV